MIDSVSIFFLSDAETASWKHVSILTYLFVTKWKSLWKSWKEANFGMFSKEIHKVHAHVYNIFLWYLKMLRVSAYYYFEFQKLSQSQWKI